MNEKQKKVILICTVLILLMAVFPPWIQQVGNEPSTQEGYGFILSPPTEEIIPPDTTGEVR